MTSDGCDQASTVPALEPSPVRRTRAYRTAEEEEGLLDMDLVSVAEMFEESTKAADMYLAFKAKWHKGSG